MRLIDADALKYKQQVMYKKGDSDEVYAEWFITATEIDKAPTIDAIPHWIPCENGMPKKEMPYQRRGYYLTTNAYGGVGLTRYEFENDFQKTGWQSDIRIVAWMPLPKPYAGERKDDE